MPVITRAQAKLLAKKSRTFPANSSISNNDWLIPFKKLPSSILFDKILPQLNIREIFQFGQALDGNKKYQNMYMTWLLSNRTRNFIYKKMTSAVIIDFLVDLQTPIYSEKQNFDFGIEFYSSVNLMRREMYEEFVLFKKNEYAPINFLLNYLAGIFLDHLFVQHTPSTTLVMDTRSSLQNTGIWIKMPGQNPNNKISWTQKIAADLLMTAPNRLGLIFIEGENYDRILLPDFYQEPIKNDPKNCHLYEYLMEWKLDTVEGHRKASIFSAVIKHLMSIRSLYEVKLRIFSLKDLGNKNRSFTRIYIPRPKTNLRSTKNYLEKLPQAINYALDEICHYGEAKELENPDLESIWTIITNKTDYTDKKACQLGYLHELGDIFIRDHCILGNFEIYGLANYAQPRNSRNSSPEEIAKNIKNELVIDESFIHKMHSVMAMSENGVFSIIDERFSKVFEDVFSVHDKSYMKLSAFDYYHSSMNQGQQPKHNIYFNIDYYWDPEEDTYKLGRCWGSDVYPYFRKEVSDLCLLDINIDPELTEKMLRYNGYMNDYENLRKIEVINDGKTVLYKRKLLDNPDHIHKKGLIDYLKNEREGIYGDPYYEVEYKTYMRGW